MGKKSKFIQSSEYYSKAVQFLPGGVSSSFRLGMQPFPLFFDHAQGSRIWDADGNEYVDYVLGMGPVILGHAHPAVDDAVRQAIGSGQLFAGQHAAELELAQEICGLVPCAERVRFSLSGSEAIQAAIRLARAFTGRNVIIKFEGQYHGWLDNIFLSVGPEKAGRGETNAPNQPASSGQDANAYLATCVLPWNDIRALCQAFDLHDGEIAAVIMEPIMCNTAVIEPQPDYLEQVQDLCRENGTVLIFDEVITGFRVDLRGAQHKLGVTPGLATFAKAMGNGYPVSCLAGRREIMDLLSGDRVVHGGTFNSNVMSCAAALTTIRTLKESEQAIYSRLLEHGTTLMNGLRAAARELGIPLHVQGLPMVFHTSFTDQAKITDSRNYRKCDLELQGRFVTKLLESGVRITGRGTWFLSGAHTQQDVDVTLMAVRAALQSLWIA